eukprot:366130-Chlamydomonas_euryale.AAC.14
MQVDHPGGDRLPRDDPARVLRPVEVDHARECALHDRWAACGRNCCAGACYEAQDAGDQVWRCCVPCLRTRVFMCSRARARIPACLNMQCDVAAVHVQPAEDASP